MEADGKCESCGVKILWRTTPGGSHMPLDVKPVAEAKPGRYVLLDAFRCTPAAPMFDDPGTDYYVSHWDTCTHAEVFRATY